MTPNPTASPGPHDQAEEPARSILDVFTEFAKTPEGKVTLDELSVAWRNYEAAGMQLSRRIDERLGLGKAKP